MVVVSGSDDSITAQTDSEDDQQVELPKAKNAKTIEQRYTKMTQLQHILARPDTYVGAISPETVNAWIWDLEKQGIVSRQITYVPALYKIFDEIIVNAADVKAREVYEKSVIATPKAKRMSRIEIRIDREQGSISVLNDGSCIPIEIHKEHGIYVPELIFGHLLTSDNYDDTEQRVTGGRNGYGAKLTNVFSTKFHVECSDSQRKRLFEMTWSENMSKHSNPIIRPKTENPRGVSDTVKVTFWPDFQRLNTPGGFNDDIIALFEKRAFDLAGTVPGISVYLNGKQLGKVKNFKDYVDLYFPGRAVNPGSPVKKKSRGRNADSEEESDVKSEPSEIEPPPAQPLGPPPLKIYEKINDMWEVVISESETGNFQQVSFVNSICTSKGGSHVSLLIDPIVQAVLKKVNTKNRGGFEVKGNHVKNHIFIFVNCRVVNPTFDSQTKEWMSLPVRALTAGGPIQASDKTIAAIVKSEITESVILWAQTKEAVELKKLMKGKGLGGSAGGRDRIIGIPKLEDANDAGTAKSSQCTLILTEGDSAKTSCIAGLSVVGKDKYGVFPLRGKLLNVRDASFQTLSENKEIQNLLKITGLEITGKGGTKGGDVGGVFNPAKLRYGSIMIMTDQDYDGSHIKGLLINLIQYYWPGLLKQNNGFLKQFITPIIKATRKRTSNNANPEILSFFTVKQYLEWKNNCPRLSDWSIKYYKGLGTSGDKEFIEYFKDLRKHSLDFEYRDEEDFEAIDMAFNSKRAEDRKRWISSFNDDDGMTYGEELSVATSRNNKVRFVDFVNKELVQFSRYDLERSVPCIVDGLKPAQRKALYGALEKGLWTKEMKVAQLAAYVSDVSCYHHGEDSMAATIVNMAQTFVGSNNINIFEPRGQFGSRKEGGKDASATRYIYTKLTKVAKLIYKPVDAPVLAYRNEEGKSIEPRYYVPIIPMILVNGSEGIGTGWSCSIPNYNPADIIANIRVYLSEINSMDDDSASRIQPMKPWYRGFIGRIEDNGKNGYESVGIVENIEEGTLFIAELPVKVWTQPYKEYLEELLQAGLARENATSGTASAKAKAKAKAKAAPKRAFQSAHKLSIEDYRDNSTHESIAFTVKVNGDQTGTINSMGGPEKALKLRKTITTTNMTLFDEHGVVRKYANELEILRDFCKVRLEYYVKRKRYQTLNMEKELCLISNKLKFVLAVVTGDIKISNRKKSELEAELRKLGFDPISDINSRYDTSNPTLMVELAPDGTLEAEIEEEKEDTATSQYDYLLSMQLYSLTFERLESLKAQHTAKAKEYEMYKKKTPEQLWIDDLDELESVLVESNLIATADRLDAEKARRIAQGLAAPAKTIRATTKRKPKKDVKKDVAASDDDDDALMAKLKNATMAAKSMNVKLTKPNPEGELNKTATTMSSSSSSNDISFMESLRSKLAAGNLSGLLEQSQPAKCVSHSNPNNKRSLTTHKAPQLKRAKKMVPDPEEEEDEMEESFSEEEVTLSEDDEDEDEESFDESD